MPRLRERAGRAVERAPLAWLAPLATAGIVAGHTLTYWAVAPQADHREALLQATGHAYWGAAVSVACVCALWAAAVHVLRNVRATLSPLASPAATARFASRLIALQVSGFVAMEIVERVGAGESLSMRMVIDHGTLLLGVVVQIAVAVLLTRVMEWLGRTTRRLTGRLVRTRPPVRRERARWVEASMVLRPAPWSIAWGIRGPPVVSSSFAVN